MSEAPYWLGFSLIPNVGARGLMLMRQTFGDLQTAWEASEVSLVLAELDGRMVESVITNRSRIDVNAEWNALERAGAHVVAQIDPRYPPLLRELADAPPLLTVRGTLEPGAVDMLTIVGTREATPHGIELAYQFARALVSSGVTIISGFAKGIDAAAHTGALDGKGRTIAVLGNGIDVTYPTDHAALGARIAAQGALVSEFKHDAAPARGRFPRRNRTMSGMSRAVLVIEAPAGSGALLTAKAARDYGRLVFVVRGDPSHPNQRGIDALIEAGAIPVNSPEALLAAWNGVVQETNSDEKIELLRPRLSPAVEVRNSVQLSPDASRVLEALKHQALHIDEIARQTSIPMHQLLGIMTSLELDGQVQVVGHSQYRRHLDDFLGRDGV